MHTKTIAIIGHFGGKENILDGQTVKTKILYEELRQATDWKIKRVDTYYKRKNPIKLVWQTALALLTAKDVVVLLSGNGMKFYFPILSFCSKVLRTRVYHDVIGGNLSRYVEKYPKFKQYLNAFRVNWVETASMQKELKAQGVINAEVMPNFKRLQCVPAEELSLTKENAPPFRFCTFSRVMREKGIEDAVRVIESINAENGRTLCTLDIYGKVDAGYVDRFTELQSRFTDAVAYRGVVNFNDSVNAIKEYYALLFPTFWDGEGFPGTLIDAFAAGLPIIATDWNCNSELIEDGVNGILYPGKTAKTLEDAIRLAISDPAKIAEMKAACVEKAKQFMPEEHIARIIESIEEGG